jgi:hypothetical protein
MNSSLSNKQLDEEEDEENDEEIISTSMSLITTSSTRSLINKQKENESSTFKFNRNDINRYHYFDSKIENKQKQQQQAPFNISKLCNDNDSNFDSSYDEDNDNDNDVDDDESSTTNTNDSLELVSINKSSISDLLLETGVYVSNIVKKKHAQLSVGDRILSINGHSLTNKTLYEIMDLIENVSQFKLVIRKQQQKKVHNKQKRESGRRNRGFIVVSQSNMSTNNNNNNNNSNSLLNQTIHSVNDIKTSSNLIFDIKDQKEIKKQINKTVVLVKNKTHHKVSKSTPPPPSAPPVDLIHHQNQVKKYYAQKLAHIEQKEQNLLDENLNKYQELIKNFHSQSRKCNQLYVDLDVIEANNNNNIKNSKNSLFKFHKTSPYLIDDIEKHDTLSLSNASPPPPPPPLPLDDDNNNKRVSITNSKKFRKSNTQPDQLKFIHRHSAPTPVQDS